MGQYIPVEFGQSRASSSNLMSLSQFIVRVWILNICVRLSRSGSPNSTLRSSRPGLNNAGSSVSGLNQQNSKQEKGQLKKMPRYHCKFHTRKWCSREIPGTFEHSHGCQTSLLLNGVFPLLNSRLFRQKSTCLLP
jgi:hypothetical protein